MAINDVVQLANGSVGVVGELTPQGQRVFFDESHLVVIDSEITATLSAPSYSIGDEITVWPHSGAITAIDGDQFTVSVQMTETFGFGPITWTGTQTVPRWRVIRDNDPRIERVWG